MTAGIFRIMKKVREKKKEIAPIDLDRYRGEWLALEQGSYRVVAHARSLSTAKKRAHQKGVEHPAMFSVPDEDHPFIGRGVILSR